MREYNAVNLDYSGMAGVSSAMFGMYVAGHPGSVRQRRICPARAGAAILHSFHTPVSPS